MATVSQTGEWISRNTRRVKWEGLANGDDGAPDGYARLSLKSVAVDGTFGSGGTMVIEVSFDDGATWFDLSDAQGNAISITEKATVEIGSAPALVRPHVTGGDGTTNLDCTMIETAR